MTSRAAILAAARRVIDRDGWQRLTVRRLAAELGVGPTTLYRNVRDREDLLILLLNEHAEQTMRPELVADPRDRIVATATAIHASLSSWPWAAEVLATDGFIARLGEPAVRMVEVIVGAAVDHGCSPEHAVHVFRSIWYYTVGEILVRARSAGAAAEALRRDDGEPFFGGIDPSRLPHLAAIGDRWPALAARESYVEGLEALVDGLLAAGAR